MSTINILEPGHLAGDEREQFALDVLMGLSTPRRSLPSKYFYDAEGSRLFQRITTLDEYYPTRCEAEVLRSHCDEITGLVADRPTTVVELGAGDGSKTRILLRAFAERGLEVEYVPVDISRDALEWLVTALSEELPSIPTRGLVSEYFDALRWLNLDANNIGQRGARALARSTTLSRDCTVRLAGNDVPIPLREALQERFAHVTFRYPWGGPD